jgi:hypothetical protein
MGNPRAAKCQSGAEGEADVCSSCLSRQLEHEAVMHPVLSAGNDATSPIRLVETNNADNNCMSAAMFQSTRLQGIRGGGGTGGSC